MKIEYVVSVKRIIDTAATGEEPKPDEVELASFTGGANGAIAVLRSVADAIEKSKKPLNWVTGIRAVIEQLEEQNKKAKAEGKPTFVEALQKIWSDEKPTATR